MDPRDSAKWIWLPGFQDHDEELPGKFVFFRKTVELTKQPGSACVVNVSADTRYRLFVNGKSVAFGPCKSYPTRWYYETIDISSHLRIGSNVITARVLRFFPGQMGSSSMMKTNTPGFILWGDIEGSPIVTDETWKCYQDESVRLQSRSSWNFILGPPFLSLDEDVNMSLAVRDWQSENFDSSRWLSAVPSISSIPMMPVMDPWKLVPRSIPFLPENLRNFGDVLKSEGRPTTDDWERLLQMQTSLTVNANEHVVVEFETDVLTTGFVEIELVGGQNADVSILYSEAYEKDLGTDKSPAPIPRVKGDRRAYKNGRLYGMEDHVRLCAKDDETTTYEPFWLRTFRFLRLSVTTKGKPLTIKRIVYRETLYPLEITTKLTLPPTLQPIWKMCVETLRKCMHETYEDCPYYEQNQFAMDSRLQLLFTYQLSRDDRLARKTIHEFYASRREDGLIETNFPVSFRPISIPQFSLYWIMMLYDHMMYFGDTRLIRKYISTADSILDHFDARVNEDGMVGAFDSECWAFVDWVKEWQGKNGIRDMAVPPIYKKTGVLAYNSLVYAWALEHAAKLSEFIGRNDTAREYRWRAEKLNTAVNKSCYDETVGFYVDGPGTTDLCEHTQIFAVLSGAVTGDDAVQLMHRTMRATSPSTPSSSSSSPSSSSSSTPTKSSSTQPQPQPQAKPMPRTSYAMKHYIFRALSQTGLYNQYFDQMLQPWRQMVSDNLTTCAEDDVSFRSDCHGWSASPIYEIVAEVFGLKPGAVGFGEVKLETRRELLFLGAGSGGSGKGDEKHGTDTNGVGGSGDNTLDGSVIGGYLKYCLPKKGEVSVKFGDCGGDGSSKSEGGHKEAGHVSNGSGETNGKRLCVDSEDGLGRAIESQGGSKKKIDEHGGTVRVCSGECGEWTEIEVVAG